MKFFVTPDIVYIGQDDAGCHLFESQYYTPEGMCFNSYLIVDEKVAIMDTSAPSTMDAWEKSLEEALNGRQPDYLVVHHLEPDHASGIGRVVAKYPGIKVVCSAKAASMLPQFFPDTDFSDRVIAVKEGDKLELGKHCLNFVAAPMVHWPEVMMSYESSEKLLFAADGFGKFGVYDSDADDWARDARRYYLNICGKYGAQVAAVLKKASGLEINQILPLHGPVLSGAKMAGALKLYGIWSSYGFEKDGVFIPYASIHGYTEEAVKKLAGMLQARGVEVELMDLSTCDMADAVQKAFMYSKVVFAASSYDAGLFTPMFNYIHLLQMKGWQKRSVAVIENGSWAPCAGRIMTEMLGGMKDIAFVGDVITLRGRATASDLEALEKLTENLSKH